MNQESYRNPVSAEGIVGIGQEMGDNEQLGSVSVKTTPETAGEFVQFINDSGYRFGHHISANSLFVSLESKPGKSFSRTFFRHIGNRVVRGNGLLDRSWSDFEHELINLPEGLHESLDDDDGKPIKFVVGHVLSLGKSGSFGIIHADIDVHDPTGVGVQALYVCESKLFDYWQSFNDREMHVTYDRNGYLLAVDFRVFYELIGLKRNFSEDLNVFASFPKSVVLLIQGDKRYHMEADESEIIVSSQGRKIEVSNNPHELRFVIFRPYNQDVVDYELVIPKQQTIEEMIDSHDRDV